MAASVVKRDGVRKRNFPQSSIKHSLCSPYHLQWPLLKNKGNQKIIDEFTRTLGPLQFEILLTKPKKAEEKKERAEKMKQLRSSIMLGVNEVTKALEKGTLRLVLVDRSIKPASLLEHLLVLCATRKVPACCISGMNEPTFAPLLGVHRLSALAFKNTDTPTEFDALIDFITELVEPLYVPWLHACKEEETPAASSLVEDNNSEEEHLPGIWDLKNKTKRFKKTKDNQENKDNSTPVSSDTVNIQGASGSTVNLPATSKSQVIGDTAINTPSGKKKRKRSRRSSKTKQTDNVGLEYQSPWVKSFDVAKGNKTK